MQEEVTTGTDERKQKDENDKRNTTAIETTIIVTLRDDKYFDDIKIGNLHPSPAENHSGLLKLPFPVSGHSMSKDTLNVDAGEI
jgi:hypothetical protein